MSLVLLVGQPCRCGEHCLCQRSAASTRPKHNLSQHSVCVRWDIVVTESLNSLFQVVRGTLAIGTRETRTSKEYLSFCEKSLFHLGLFGALFLWDTALSPSL